jgi:hypothetical protein
MCRVELRVCFRCGRLGHLIKLCPSLAALTQSNSCVASVECGSYTCIYVIEDLGHIVNMVKVTIPHVVANLLPPKSSTFSGQWSAKTVCSSKVCPLTPSNAKVRPTITNAANVAACIILLCCSIVCIWLIEFYPFVCLTMHCYMDKGHQTFKINVHDHFYWWRICPQ